MIRRNAFPVLTAQFLTAFADSMLMFVVIGAMKTLGYGLTTIPYMGGAFLIVIVLLAPFVGSMTDSFPKNQVLLVSVGFKLLPPVILMAGGHPLWAYACAGVAAAIHHTVKWAILPELAPPERLIRTNGLNEIVSLVGIIGGAATGGYAADHHATIAPTLVLVITAAGFLIAAFIPRLTASNPVRDFHPLTLLGDFVSTAKQTLSSRTARFTLFGTSIYSACVGMTRDLMIVWVPTATAVNDNFTPALLSNALILGIVTGALAVGHVPRHALHRTSYLGIVPGVLLVALVFVKNPIIAAGLVFAIGACAGLFKIPLNSLAQTRAHGGSGAGRSMAVQSFGQNATILILQFGWGGLVYLGAGGLTLIAYGGGAVFFAAAFMLMGRPANDKINGSFGG